MDGNIIHKLFETFHLPLFLSDIIAFMDDFTYFIVTQVRNKDQLHTYLTIQIGFRLIQCANIRTYLLELRFQTSFFPKYHEIPKDYL